VTLKIRQKTPIGARPITRSMMATVTWPRLSSHLSRGSAFSPERVLRATPSIREKKMTASMSPSAAALTGLRGTIFTSRSIPKLEPDRPVAPSACPR
jgi:hypothetical protein